MRLTGDVFNDRSTLRQHRRQHDVDRRADGDLVEVDVCAGAATIFRLTEDIAAGKLHLRAERREALEVLVDGALAEVAATGHGALGTAKTRQHGTDEVVAGADTVRQLEHFLRQHIHLDIGRIDLHRAGAYHAHPCAHAA